MNVKLGYRTQPPELALVVDTCNLFSKTLGRTYIEMVVILKKKQTHAVFCT